MVCNRGKEWPVIPMCKKDNKTAEQRGARRAKSGQGSRKTDRIAQPGRPVTINPDRVATGIDPTGRRLLPAHPCNQDQLPTR